MDLIERQAAITLPIMPKEHREYQTFNLDDAYEQGWNDLQKCIELLPLAQPEPRWIPMTEQLPKNGYYYLWCSDMGSVQMDYYFNGFEHGQEYGYNIVAWMPRPKPYERSEE